MMGQETRAIEQTYFVPLSGLDAVNYLVIASQVKVAVHDDVQAEHRHFGNDLRSIIHLHKQHLRTVVDEDGSVRKSTSREVILRFDDLLHSLKVEGLRLCFRMWSIHSADELVQMALTKSEAVDNEGNSDEAQQKSDSDGYGAIVAFLIVPESIPMLISDIGNSHTEICVTQVPNWQSLSNELAGA